LPILGDGDGILLSAGYTPDLEGEKALVSFVIRASL
jgi:hypothetical protein